MTNGKKHTPMSFEQLHELLQMTATQTAENAKQIDKFSKEFKADLLKSKKVHDREMAEIRKELKNPIKRIAA